MRLNVSLVTGKGSQSPGETLMAILPLACAANPAFVPARLNESRLTQRLKNYGFDAFQWNCFSIWRELVARLILPIDSAVDERFVRCCYLSTRTIGFGPYPILRPSVERSRFRSSRAAAKSLPNA